MNETAMTGHYLVFGSLWMQVLIAAVVTFVASALLWTVIPLHRSEFKPLPNEDAVRKVLHAQGVTQGQWRIPFSDNRADWNTPEFMKRFETGPVGIIQLEAALQVAQEIDDPEVVFRASLNLTTALALFGLVDRILTGE